MRVAVVLLSVLAAASACTSGNSFDNLQLVQQYAPVDCPQSAPVQCNGTNTAFTTLHGLCDDAFIAFLLLVWGVWHVWHVFRGETAL
jgi:hypothetical protein